MPTDLTGTPTSLGIGTYNPDDDAPSGLGFNAAMAQIDLLLDARVSKPAGILSGEVPVWNGSSFVRSTVTHLGPTSLGSGTPTTDTYLRGDGVWVAPQGFEWHYSETAADVSVTGTSSAAATPVLAGSSVVYDGTPIIIQFFTASLTRGTTNIQVALYDGATYVANFLFSDQPGNLPAGVGYRKLTPSAGAHTYNVKAFVDAGTGIVRGTGVGGLPIAFRITKA